jgi:hypothetical protein
MVLTVSGDSTKTPTYKRSPGEGCSPPGAWHQEVYLPMQDYSLARPALPSEVSTTEERIEAEVGFAEASFAFFLLADTGSQKELERAGRAMDDWASKLQAL